MNLEEAVYEVEFVNSREQADIDLYALVYGATDFLEHFGEEYLLGKVFHDIIGDDDGQTKDLIEAEGVGHEFMKIDITEEGAPRKIIETCVVKLGAIDILVNSAGISILEEVQNFGREQWDKMVRINLTAAFELSFEASKFMIPQKSGKIINICSLFSFLGGQWSPAYASTKHGLAGLTKTYCDELEQHNIQVNGIAPG